MVLPQVWLRSDWSGQQVQPRPQVSIRPADPYNLPRIRVVGIIGTISDPDPLSVYHTKTKKIEETTVRYKTKNNIEIKIKLRYHVTY